MQSTYLFRVPEIKVPLWALRVMPKRLALALSRAKETHSITKDPFHFLLNILFLDLAQASFVIDKLMGLCEVHWLFTIKKKKKNNTLLFIQYRVPYELTVKTKPLSKLMIFFFLSMKHLQDEIPSESQFHSLALFKQFSSFCLSFVLHSVRHSGLFHCLLHNYKCSNI